MKEESALGKALRGKKQQVFDLFIGFWCSGNSLTFVSNYFLLKCDLCLVNMKALPAAGSIRIA